MGNVDAYKAISPRGKIGKSIDEYLEKEHTLGEIKNELNNIKEVIEELFKINDIKIIQEGFAGLFSEGYYEIQKKLNNKEYNKYPIMTYTSVLKMPVECYLKQYHDRTEFWIDYVEMKSGTKVKVNNLVELYKGMLLALGIEIAIVEKYL